jgi:hypothetical protein
MNMGAGDKKKVGALVVLGGFALYMVYSNLLSGPPGAPADSAPRATVQAPASPISAELPATKRAPTRARNEEFHPVLRSKRPEDRIDTRTVDPTLKLDLLAKVVAVEPSGGNRNLFAFGQPPPKAADKPTGPEPRIAMGPPKAPDPPPPPGPAVEPPPPPITLKFYGFSTIRTNGKKSAYFLDGDDILIATEGDTLKRRYKLVRISAGSALVEDTESKRQQSLPLAPEAPAS